MLGYRSSDAVLTICQKNASKSIEIVEVNEAAGALMGYANDELKGRALVDIVSPKLAGLFSEYVEYEDDANDVGMVLSKVQAFAVIGKDKKEKAFRLKVVRGQSTPDALTFRLVLQDTLNARKDNALMTLIQENFKGHEVLHPQLKVPDRKSLEKDLDLMAYYHHKAEMRASFVVLQVDHFDAFEKQYSATQCEAFLQHLIKICRDNLRPTDVVGAASDTQLGILLLDSVSDLTRMVANRLRWQIAAHPFLMSDKSSLPLSISMIYTNVDGKNTGAKMISACEAALLALPAGTASYLSEVTV